MRDDLQGPVPPGRAKDTSRMTRCEGIKSVPPTSRERIQAALDRRRCDRIPFGELVIDHRCAEAVLGRPTPVHNIPM